MNNSLLSGTPQKKITPIEQYILHLRCSFSLHLGLTFSLPLYSREIFLHFLEVTPLSSVTSIIKYRQYTVIEVRATVVNVYCWHLSNLVSASLLCKFSQQITSKFVVALCAFCKLEGNFGFFCSVNHLTGPLRKHMLA